MTPSHPAKTPNAGFVLVEPLVAAMLLGGLVVCFTTFLNLYSRFLSHIAIEGDVEALREKVRNSLSCEKSVEPSNVQSKCDVLDGRFIVGRTEDRSQSIAEWNGSDSSHAPYSLRLLCRSFPEDHAKYEVIPEFALGRSVSGELERFKSDPFSHQTYAWGKLFNIPIICPKPNPLARMNCTPGIIADTLTFEDLDEEVEIDESLNAMFRNKYGTTFTSKEGGALTVAKITSRGDHEPAFYAWLSVLCPGRPNHNRLCNGKPPVGRKVLSTANAMSTTDISFEISYVEPVQSFSFDLLDLDGGENWVITTYDGNDRVIKNTNLTSGGYGRRSGNNAATHFSIQEATRSIKKVLFTGHKTIKIFGFSFDNFRTGLIPCS